MSQRIAILGSGLAARIHSNTLKAVAPGVTRMYASRDAARAAETSRRFGGAGHFGSYDEAIQSNLIDAILICLPPSLHLDWTLKALAAGKHVIVEKPPFLVSTAFDEVERTATRAGRQVMVAENYFYKPLTGLLRRLVTEGAFGDLLFLQLNALKTQKTSDWRDDEATAGGGALFEGGIHWVSLLASIGLTPARVRASFPAAPVGRGGMQADAVSGTLERSALVTIDYAEGGTASLAYSWDVPALINGVRMSRASGTKGILRFETNGIFATLLGAKGPRIFVPGLRDLAGYRAMTIDFLDAIEQNRPPRYDMRLARRDLQLVEAAYASAALRTPGT